MSESQLKTVAADWSRISHIIFVPHTEQEYHRLVVLLDSLIDEIGEDEQHPLASLMELLGTLIGKYEEEHVPELGESIMSLN